MLTKPLVTQAQDTVTVPQDGSPVIGASDENPWRECVQAANFLRCGCKSVQIACGPELYDLGFSERIEKHLAALSLEGEKFLTKSTKSLGDGDLIVVTITLSKG